MTIAADARPLVTLITGAASGIGRVVARQLAGSGTALCLVDLPGTEL
jgi:short-subunit dehydrogenase